MNVEKSILVACLTLFMSTGVMGGEFNVLDYGAKSDTAVLSTRAFNDAIRACHKSGGGRVIVPAGSYRSGTITVLDHVELHLERGAVLYASTSHEDFPRQTQPDYRSQKDPGGWYALIYAEGARDIGVTGSGTIHGQGTYQMPRPGELDGDRDGRPRNILFISCRKVRVEGLTMLHSGIWNQHYLHCEDVHIDGIEVYNHSNKNNDAINIDGCHGHR